MDRRAQLAINNGCHSRLEVTHTWDDEVAKSAEGGFIFDNLRIEPILMNSVRQRPQVTDPEIENTNHVDALSIAGALTLAPRRLFPCNALLVGRLAVPFVEIVRFGCSGRIEVRLERRHDRFGNDGVKFFLADAKVLEKNQQ